VGGVLDDVEPVGVGAGLENAGVVRDAVDNCGIYPACESRLSMIFIVSRATVVTRWMRFTMYRGSS
jgi:hypothetical protein